MSSLDNVASATGIDASRLDSIEKGQTEPTGDDVLIHDSRKTAGQRGLPTDASQLPSGRLITAPIPAPPVHVCRPPKSRTGRPAKAAIAARAAAARLAEIGQPMAMIDTDSKSAQ